LPTQVSIRYFKTSSQQYLVAQVVIPRVYPLLSTDQVLTMEYVDGVPILDVALMDVELKTQLISALVGLAINACYGCIRLNWLLKELRGNSFPGRNQQKQNPDECNSV
jgi:hypothetical protein